jgi:hypothetical protein
MNNKKTYLFIIILFQICTSFSQKNEKKYTIRTIAFYNLENLFDTINDLSINDEASPMMELKFNRSKVYWDKIDKLASTIAQIGLEDAKTSPAIIGVSEVENRSVLEDLIKSKHLIQKNMALCITTLLINAELT